jgi:hypothetical protein
MIILLFIRVLENTIVQAGDLEFGRKDNLRLFKDWQWKIWIWIN